MRTAKVVAAFWLAFLGLVAQAQTATPGPTFEVVSVKPNHEVRLGREHWQLTSSSGRLSTSYITVQSLIWNAYTGILPSHVLNAPGWTDSDHFDIEATGSPITSGAQLQAQLQALLADRFKLAAHHETRNMDIFSLVLARRDGKLGPNLQRSNVDCSELIRAKSPLLQRTRADEFPPCSKNSDGPYGFRLVAVPVSALAESLTSLVRRTVVDHTGLVGAFDFQLHWSPDQAVDPSAPEVFTALQEQLGLKLESTQGPEDVLVIDHVEQPTEN